MALGAWLIIAGFHRLDVAGAAPSGRLDEVEAYGGAGAQRAVALSRNRGEGKEHVGLGRIAGRIARAVGSDHTDAGRNIEPAHDALSHRQSAGAKWRGAVGPLLLGDPNGA